MWDSNVETVMNIMTTCLQYVHKGEFLRSADIEVVFAWTRLHLADQGIYTAPKGEQQICYISYFDYQTLSRRAMDEAIVADARKTLALKGT